MGLVPDLELFPLPAWIKRRAARRFLKTLDDPLLSSRSELQVDFNECIRPFIKRNVDLTSLIDVGVDLLANSVQSCKPFYKQLVWLYDAPYYFVLTFKINGELMGAAVLGFKVTAASLNIIQIQGLKFVQKHNNFIDDQIKSMLQSLKWERLLVSFAENWAIKNGFRRAKIQKAESNAWFIDMKKYESVYIGRNDRLKMHYDVTAKRSGYKSLNKKWWGKKLTQTAGL
ncbi:MAG: hypothetical protein AAB784_00570 [Patescibacteria group bacterium]